MDKTRRIICALLADVMLASAVLLGGCAGEKENTGTGEDTADVTLPDVEIVLGENGKSKYTVIIPEKGQYGESSAGSKFYMGIGAAAYQGFKYSDDWLKPGTEEDPEAYEIVIGETNRTVSSELAEKLKSPKDYILAVKGNRIAVYSESAYGIQKAMEDLTARLKNEDGRLTVSVPEYMCVPFDYPAKDMKIGGRPLSDYVIVVPRRDETSDKLSARINSWVFENAGYELPVVTGSDKPSECEIILGNTGRNESEIYYKGDQVLKKGEYAVSLTGTKLVAAYPSYSGSAMNNLMNRLEPAEDLSEFSTRDKDDGLTVLRNDNFAAGKLSDELLDSVNPGVLAEMSCIMYYEAKLQEGIAKGYKWQYSNKGWANNYFKAFDVINRGLDGYRSCNCDSGHTWILQEIYGGTTYRDIADFYEEVHQSLQKRLADGNVKPGDILFGYVSGADGTGSSHRYIYLGDGITFDTGHGSGGWHEDKSIKHTDPHCAVFDTWLHPTEKGYTYNGYIIKRQIRIRDDFVPVAYRNSEGRLVSNPMVTEKGR